MNICVYGSSSNSIPQSYLKAGYELGKQIASRGYGMVFGGGCDGMMGAAVRGMQSEGGWSIGIAPTFFQGQGVLFRDCSEWIFTKTMRERKHLMEHKSSAFIMTAGGIGTLEEFFEVLTLKQLSQLNKPICILNTDGCFDELDALLKQLVKDGFMSADNLNLYFMSASIDEILNYIEKNACADSERFQK
ncbi:MAG: TIGR00730 family Rossman fold protein [Ileibacterium sp.]|nr:TIGR00730 family Rossman fold protein [Ileibacterium sp.]